MWLIFGERSLDQYMSSTNQVVDPLDLRMHDLSDAVAIPGCSPVVRAIKSDDNESLTLGVEDNGAQIHIKNGGVIELNFAGGNMLTIQSQGSTATMTLGTGADHPVMATPTAAWWLTVLSAFLSHTHLFGGVPTSGAQSPLPAWASSNASGRVGFPNG